MAKKKDAPRAHGNRVTVVSTVEAVLRSGPFVAGFKSSRTGGPWAYDAYPSARDQTRYERGRHFAVIYKGPLKDGRRLVRAAACAFAEAYMSKHVL